MRTHGRHNADRAPTFGLASAEPLGVTSRVSGPSGTFYGTFCHRTRLVKWKSHPGTEATEWRKQDGGRHDAVLPVPHKGFTKLKAFLLKSTFPLFPETKGHLPSYSALPQTPSSPSTVGIQNSERKGPQPGAEEKRGAEPARGLCPRCVRARGLRTQAASDQAPGASVGPAQPTALLDPRPKTFAPAGLCGPQAGPASTGTPGRWPLSPGQPLWA